MKKQSPVSGSSKEVSAKRKRDEDEVEDMDSVGSGVPTNP